MKKVFTFWLTMVGFLTPFTGFTQIPADYLDSLALVDLYNFANGISWNNNSGWLTTPVSNWYGVSLDSNGKVVQLSLYNNKLSGILPATLGNLSQLNYLSLYKNNISGPLPASLCNLQNLTTLDLSQNSLDGGIPSFFGNLQSLQSFSLAFNRLTGSIPTSFIALKNLVTFAVGVNQLSGDIPAFFSGFINLQFFSIAYNNFSGAIPQSFSSLSNLKYFNVSNNHLSGVIPDLFNSLPFLSTVDISHNLFAGQIPFSLLKLTSLQYLDLSFNNLKSPLPIFGNAWSNLSFLNISNNEFRFDQGLEDIAKKLSFAVYWPQALVPLNANGTFAPFSVSAVAQSEPGDNSISDDSIYWYKNGIQDTIIKGDTSYVPNVYRSGDVFTAKITNHVTDKLILYSTSNTVSYLYTPAVNKNDSLALVDLFNSTGSTSWTNHKNWLSAPVSTWFGVTLFNGRVTMITMPTNNLTGSLPASIGAFSELQGLNLGFNHLNGNIPSSVGNLLNLKTLKLEGNELIGQIPSSLGNLRNLIYLELFNNALTGTIPSSLESLGKLIYADLSGNLLTGNIPAFMNGLSALNTLFIQDNNFDFDGMETVAQRFPFALYSPQAPIKIHNTGYALSVSAGGLLSKNTYRWFRNEVLVATKVGDSTFNVNVSGNYYVNVTNSIAKLLNLLSDTVAITYFVITQSDSSVKLYPNPATNYINIITQHLNNITVELFTMAGTKLSTISNVSGTYKLNISAYDPGIYVLYITDQVTKKQTRLTFLKG